MSKRRFIQVFVAIFLLYCISVAICRQLAESKTNGREVLLGINGMNLGPQVIDMIFYNPINHTWSTFLPNITGYSYSTWFIPSFFTSYCSISRVFYLVVDDITENKLVAVDVRRRKVIGTMKFDGRLKYQHCDETTGDILGLLYTSGRVNTKLARVDFKGRKTTVVLSMKHNYLPYYASALDMSNKRFFFNTVLPRYESLNYTVVTLNFKTQKTQVSQTFTNYSIGGLLYEASTEKLFGFMQTPPTGYEGPKYKAMIGQLSLRGGSFKNVSGVWPGQGGYYDVGLTLDPRKRLMYIILYDKLITLCVETGETLYVDEQKRQGIGLHFAII